MQWFQGEYRLTDRRADMDAIAIHAYLQRSYWAAGIPLATVIRAVDHSLCFGVFRDAQQVAFARVISDFTTFAYRADVYVLEAHRGHGLSKWIMTTIGAYPDLQGLRRWMLATRDAHGLYKQSGFSALLHPEWMMEITTPDIYQQHDDMPPSPQR
jgi:GNAT superfamily N-acetyltransferase